MQQQPIGGRQHHFEENEEIEEVTGQERAVDAHQHHLEQRMEMRTGLVPLGHGVNQRRNGKQRRQQHHQAGKTVGDKHDAEGRRPVAEQVDAARNHRGDLGIDGRVHLAEQQDGDHQQQHGGGEADGGFRHALALVEEQQQGCGDQRH
ncbi:hypothetical protein D3C86_1749740 [compost metagenome]